MRAKEPGRTGGRVHGVESPDATQPSAPRFWSPNGGQIQNQTPCCLEGSPLLSLLVPLRTLLECLPAAPSQESLPPQISSSRITFPLGVCTCSISPCWTLVLCKSSKPLGKKQRERGSVNVYGKTAVFKQHFILCKVLSCLVTPVVHQTHWRRWVFTPFHIVDEETAPIGLGDKLREQPEGACSRVSGHPWWPCKWGGREGERREGGRQGGGGRSKSF